QPNRLQRRPHFSGLVAHCLVTGDDAELEEPVVPPTLDLARLEQRTGEQPSRSDLDGLRPEVDRLEPIDLARLVAEVVRIAPWAIGMGERRLRELTAERRAPAFHAAVGEECAGEVFTSRHRHGSLAE